MDFLLWITFFILIGILVTIDLRLSNHNKKPITLARAMSWSLFWIALALLFNAAIYFIYEYGYFSAPHLLEPKSGATAALQFFTGYLLEKSLSLDNIFIISVIFSYYKVPLNNQHRVLIWGIITAAVLRGILITFGITLVETVSWIFYVFGAFLLIGGIKLLINKETSQFCKESRSSKFIKYFIPITSDFHGENFFIKENNVWKITPLFLALIQIEAADLIFALDSIPAIFAITLDPFIVYTSNIFAIFGLRALYFTLAPLIHQFRFISSSLALILVYIGIKMLASHDYPISNIVSLLIIICILTAGVVLSILFPKKNALN